MSHLDEGTIHAWLDGALAAGEARQADAHVAGCAACAGAVAEARGLIAASSMILSKLDGVMPERDAQPAIPNPSMRDIAVARAEAAVRQRPGVRRWFAGSPMRAAAAVLILGGGVAVVGNMTSRDELAGVVADAAMEREVGVAVDSARLQVASGAAQDATAAEVEHTVGAPSPTVAAAPSLRRPTPAAGGGAAARQAEPRAPARIADGSVAGIGAATAESREATTITTAPAVPPGAGTAGAAAEEQRGARRLEERLRRVEQPPERDFAGPGRAGASAPAAPPAAAPAPTAMESMRLADSTLSLQSARRATEQSAQRPVPQAAKALAERLAQSEAAVPAAAAAVLVAPRCYALALGPWSPAGTTTPYAPPMRIVLSPDTGTAGAARGRRLVRPMPGAAEGGHADAWWTEVSPSTLVLTWATGSEGIVMRLVRSGSDVSGTARTFGTAGGVERTSLVTGTAVDCGDAR